MTDRLKQLLRAADAASPTPAGPTDLDARVLHRRARERLRRPALATAIVLIVASAWLIPWFRPRHLPPTAQIDSGVIREQLAALQIEAQLHEQTADALIAVLRAAPPPLAPGPSEAQLARDRAALILVYDADRSIRANRPEDAVAGYRRAIELFPNTPAADVARERLKQMQT
jgi:hypothetical protein